MEKTKNIDVTAFCITGSNNGIFHALNFYLSEHHNVYFRLDHTLLGYLNVRLLSLEETLVTTNVSKNHKITIRCQEYKGGRVYTFHDLSKIDRVRVSVKPIKVN